MKNILKSTYPDDDDVSVLCYMCVISDCACCIL